MEDWEYEDFIWFGVGSAETLQEIDRPRFRSVSPAAHRTFLIDRGRAAHRERMKARPAIGFHRPPVR